MLDRAMSRGLLIGMFFLARSLWAPCQETFITHLDSVQTGYDASGRSVRETTDGYLVFAWQQSLDGTGNMRPAVYKLANDGSFLSRYEIGTGEPLGAGFGLFDPVTSSAEGGFVSILRTSNGYGYDMDLAFFDSAGDLNSTTDLMSSPVGDSIILGNRQLRPTSDGGLVFCGFLDLPDASAKALLVKVDSTGSVVWQQTYEASGQAYDAVSVAQYVDGGYVLSGYRLPETLNGLGFVIRTDSAGNQLWRKHFGNEAGANGVVRVTEDGGIITFASYAEPDWPWGWQQYLLTRWDEFGGIDWQTHSHYFYSVSAFDFEVLPDQSMIAVGTYTWKTELVKYSALGDSLWSRQLTVFTNLGDHVPTDVEIASDGGFLVTGFAIQVTGDPTPGTQTIFVIKTDSLGCVIPGCQNVGVQEYVMDLQKDLRVSPNPASEVVNVSLDLPEGGEVQGQAQVHLLDGSGRLVAQQSVQQDLNKLSANLVVSALPSGAYYLHLRDAKRWLAGSKVILE
jgi:Secretion system C-terminal sorting domain